ncbi:heme-binding protein [Polynucleobacter paneuropaeus]|nr:heme-binding protein [Polynucleobacter paneuropaeus]QWD07052.1 heme-binding protein [Polynucleobacter paneuropaeus]
MMRTKPYITQANVQKILDAANQYAIEKGHIVAIAVCDDGGHLLGLIRRDGCQPISSYFAQEKARTAAMGRRETLVYEEMINKGRHAFLSAPHISMMLEGGINIVVDGHTIGAIGVSGVKNGEDGNTARAGIAAILN